MPGRTEPTGRPPHLLYVAWGFPPCRSGGVFRALATANAFARGGWRVTVLTAEREAFDRYTGVDPSLEAHIDPRVRVERLPFTWPLMETDVRLYSRARAASPALWRQLHLRRQTLDFPEPGYGSWRSEVEAGALRVHEADPVDLCLATANPNVDFTAPWVLWRKHGVPYVLDHRDAWLLDVFDGTQLHADSSRAARWERKLFDAAHEVWFVNEPIRAWHRERYPAIADRMHVVSNGFDPELAPVPRSRAADAAPRPMTFGYIGTISPKVPLAELVQGWRWARDHDAGVAGGHLNLHGYLGFYATPRADLKAIVDDAADAGVGYLGPVAKAEIARTYETFDALVLAIGAGRYVTSGKVFEYMATGLPIVSAHDPANAASDVLRGYPLWFPAADLTPRGIGQALTAAAEAVRAADPDLRRKAQEFAASYSRDLQLPPRVTALREAIAPGAPAGSTEQVPVAAAPAEATAATPAPASRPQRVVPVRALLLFSGRRITAERRRQIESTLTAAAGRDVELDLATWFRVPEAETLGSVRSLAHRPVTVEAQRPAAPAVAEAAPAAQPAATQPAAAPAPRPPAAPATAATGPSRLTRHLPPSTRQAYWSGRRAMVRYGRRVGGRAALQGVSWRFARKAGRDGDVLAAASQADLVIALDTASTAAAWELARRVARPTVVVGLGAAERWLKQEG